LVDYAASTCPGDCSSPIWSRTKNGIIALHLYGGKNQTPSGLLIDQSFSDLVASKTLQSVAELKMVESNLDVSKITTLDDISNSTN